MTLPLAALPTSPTPGVWVTVDLTAKNVAAGSQPIRACIIGPKGSTGDITPNTGLRAVYSVEDTEKSHGQGTVVPLAYKALKRRWPSAQVDVLSPTPSAGTAASGGVQVSGTITAGYTGEFDIHGRVIQVPWNVGETPAQFHAKAVQYINRYTRDLLVTASVGTAPDRVLLQSKCAGPIGNDVRIGFRLIDGAGGTITTADTALTGGSTEPDYTAVLAAISGREYDFIGLCLSNADAALTSGSLAKLETHIDLLSTGPAAKLQQGVVGHTGLRTAAMASAAARNSFVIELINAQNARLLPCELMGEELGDKAALVGTQISANRIGREYSGQFYGSADPVSDNPSLSQSDAALLSGVSVVGYRENGTPFLVRAVTTCCTTPEGAQLLPTDCNEIDAMYQCAKDLRVLIATEYRGAKIARDSEGAGEEPLPEGVVEERDVRATIVNRFEKFWIPKGVINRAHFRENVANGTLAVRVNDTDETQVDMFVPAKPFKNAAKFGLYVSKSG